MGLFSVVACQHTAVTSSAVCCAARGDQTVIFHVCRIPFIMFCFFNNYYIFLIIL